MALATSELDIEIDEQKRKLTELEEKNMKERYEELLGTLKKVNELLSQVPDLMVFLFDEDKNLSQEMKDELGKEFDKTREILNL